ncbi:transporter substrate-binding domain-containing protein [Guyparkeria hydrothermalis]|uniref:transporter substrate-binding domain-containing diguanylate cyclase n=1 Tax=Guyparkeria hydrothermalis TaxID=923 RepID=UPI0020221B2A|nr:transporter substrate-binding domain-containing protein [Guyparkeria hydrothermalis]MCL7744860.1 transporter substrate-binding domain-containing protein [Guyparkeria hydrothermalis]
MKNALLLGWISLLLFSGSLQAAPLSPEEQAFLDRHPTATIAMMVDHPPFSVIRDGSGAGFEHDVLRLVSEKTGLEFRKEFGVWSDALPRFRSGQVDMIASISYREDRTGFTLYTEPYYTIPVFVFVRDDFGAYTGIEDLAGRKVGVIEGIFYEADLRQAADVELRGFETYQEMTRALVLGQIDAFVQNLTNINQVIQRRAYTNIRIGGELKIPGLAEEDLRFGINPDKPELRSIVQKGLDEITLTEWEALTSKWLAGRQNGFLQDARLTEEERAYLREAGPIDICIDPNWMPFERFDTHGDYVGISADYFELFEKTLSTRFRPLPTATWTESVDALKAGRCDLFSLAMRTPEREKYLEFTDSYIETPLVIATKADVAFITGLDDLQGRKIAIPALYAFAELLKDDYPDLELIEVTDIDGGLDMVRDGEVFGYIGTLATIGYKLQTEYTGELRITGDTGKSWDMGVAVREDRPVLHGIMQKAVASVTDEQKRAINNKWISVRYEERIDYMLLWQVIGFFIVVLLAGLFVYLRQSGLKRQLEEAYRRAERLAVTDKLTGVCNRHRLDEVLGEEARKAERYGDVFGVVLLDVDHFKRINDRFGHRTGDIALKEFVDVLRENCRQTDVLGRWGGEEFLVIVPHADQTTLLTLAKKLRTAIETTSFSEVGQVTTSIGASLYHDGDTPDTLIKRADDALYEAKRQGRNSVAFR